MSNTSPPSYDVFIAHAPADRAWVHDILMPALWLPDDRVITPDSFQLGAPIPSEFSRAVESSHYTIVVLTRASCADPWLAFVDMMALDAQVVERKRLIPVILEKVELPRYMRILVSLDATIDAERPEALKRLRESLGLPALVEPTSTRQKTPSMMEVETPVEAARPRLQLRHLPWDDPEVGGPFGMRQRQAMLDVVERQWIQGRLERSMHSQAPIALPLADVPEMVESPWVEVESMGIRDASAWTDSSDGREIQPSSWTPLTGTVPC